jgi:hypothetical protein
MFYKVQADSRQIAWTTILQAPPWPEGAGIFEAKDQAERILLARPDKVLRNPATRAIEAKPYIFLGCSSRKLAADGKDEVTVGAYGIPEGGRLSVTVSGQPAQIANRAPIKIRATAPRQIVVKIADPYVQTHRRSIVIEAEAPGA